VVWKQPCGHDPGTPVPRLCDECKTLRRRVRDRINRRKARARKRGKTPRPSGPTALSAEATVDLADAVDYLRALLADLDGETLTPLEHQLAHTLRQIASVLEPALQLAMEETTEIARGVSDSKTYDGKKPKFAQ
jgi:hypothetical protein